MVYGAWNKIGRQGVALFLLLCSSMLCIVFVLYFMACLLFQLTTRGLSRLHGQRCRPNARDEFVLGSTVINGGESNLWV